MEEKEGRRPEDEKQSSGRGEKWREECNMSEVIRCKRRYKNTC